MLGKLVVPFLCTAMEDQLNDLVVTVRENILGTINEFQIPPRTDDAFLTKFIRTRKYDTTAAFLSVQKYYSNIHDNLGRMEGLCASAFEKVFDMNILGLLKHQLNGALICCWNVKTWEASVVSYVDINVAAAFILEELLLIPQFQINGYHIIVDISNFGFSHARQMSYHDIKFSLKITLERFPIRVAGLHLVNYPRVFWPLIQLTISLLPKKLKERVYLYNNYESLAKFFSPEILPKSAGGTLDEEEAWNNEIITKLQANDVCYDRYWKCSSLELVE